MPAKIVDGVSPPLVNKRRSVRYKLDVPLRVIHHKQDADVIREGRGTEISEFGMCVMAGLEIGIGIEVDIEFTLPYSGEPIRVSAAVRNRTGYRYGCEFVTDGLVERKDVKRLRNALQTLGAVS